LAVLQTPHLAKNTSNARNASQSTFRWNYRGLHQEFVNRARKMLQRQSKVSIENGISRSLHVETELANLVIGINPGTLMKLSKHHLTSLSMDELWALHEEVGVILSERITSEKRGLEERLAKLTGGLIFDGAKIKNGGSQPGERRGGRREYPPVLPKFRNPSNPSETWAGRGRQPRWVVAQLKAGKKMDDFLIDRSKRRRAKQG
jgi:DNA-binding protein H-NS